MYIYSSRPLAGGLSLCRLFSASALFVGIFQHRDHRMDPQTFLDVATVVTKLKMYPYFDVAHYVLCCIAVRDDIVPQGEQDSDSLSMSMITY